MKCLLPALLFLTSLYGGPVTAQNLPKTKLYTLKVITYQDLDTYDTLSVRTVTHAGDTVNLGSYIADHYIYPDNMVDLMIDGSMYYRLTVDGTNRLDSLVCLRPIDRYTPMDPDPLDGVFKNLSAFLFPEGIQAGILRIQVNILWDKIPKTQPVEILEIIPHKKRKRGRR